MLCSQVRIKKLREVNSVNYGPLFPVVFILEEGGHSPVAPLGNMVGNASGYNTSNSDHARKSGQLHQMSTEN